jgi:hypothetical protein
MSKIPQPLLPLKPQKNSKIVAKPNHPTQKIHNERGTGEGKPLSGKTLMSEKKPLQ